MAVKSKKAEVHLQTKKNIVSNHHDTNEGAFDYQPSRTQPKYKTTTSGSKKAQTRDMVWSG